MEAISGNILAYNGKIQDSKFGQYQFLTSVPLVNYYCMSVDEENQLIYALNKNSSTLNVIDISTFNVITTISLDPFGLSDSIKQGDVQFINCIEYDYFRKDRLYITNFATGNVYTISTIDFSIITTVYAVSLKMSSAICQSVLTKNYIFFGKTDYTNYDPNGVVRYSIESGVSIFNQYGSGSHTISIASIAYNSNTNTIIYYDNDNTAITGSLCKLIDPDSFTITNDSIEFVNSNSDNVQTSMKFIPTLSVVLHCFRAYGNNTYGTLSTIYNLKVQNPLVTLSSGDRAIARFTTSNNFIQVNGNYLYILSFAKMDIYKLN